VRTISEAERNQPFVLVNTVEPSILEQFLLWLHTVVQEFNKMADRARTKLWGNLPDAQKQNFLASFVTYDHDSSTLTVKETIAFDVELLNAIHRFYSQARNPRITELGDEEKYVIVPPVSSAQVNQQKSTLSQTMKFMGVMQLFATCMWFQKWCLATEAHLPVQAFQAFAGFGMASFIIKFPMDIAASVFHFRKLPYVRDNGEKITKRRVTKGVFKIAEIGLSIGVFVSYFLLHAACATPIFLAASALVLVRSVFQLTKNIVKAKQFCKEVNGELEKAPEYSDEQKAERKLTLKQVLFGGSYYDKKVERYQPDSKQAPTRDQVVKSRLAYHRSKIRRSALDVGYAVTAIVSTVIFTFMPVVGVFALLISTIAYAIARYKLRKKARANKSQAVNQSTLFKNHKENQHKSAPKVKKEEKVEKMAEENELDIGRSIISCPAAMPA